MAVDGAYEFQHGGAMLHLLPQRAIWWPATSTLIVADVHLGKGTAFRTAGLPVPTGSSAKDLSRLTDLLRRTAARRLIVLGDLVHARRSHQAELAKALAAWRAEHRTTDVVLVRGNHDRTAGRLADALDIQEVDGQLQEGGLVMQHEPTPAAQAKAVLAGHVHPAVLLRDFDGSRLSLPCFAFGDDGIGILPAFGSFTGGAVLPRVPKRRCFACAGTRVVEVRS